MFTPPPVKSDPKFPGTSSGSSFSSNGASSSSQTIIARGVHVEGDFTSQGHVTIEGKLEGSLTCGGHLTIGPEAVIQAAVHADEATISGRVEGNINVKRRLEAKSTARIKGDIDAESLVVEGGAAFEGRLQIGGGKSSEQKELVKVKPAEPSISPPSQG